jgi:hypothetical protein
VDITVGGTVIWTKPYDRADQDPHRRHALQLAYDNGGITEGGTATSCQLDAEAPGHRGLHRGVRAQGTAGNVGGVTVTGSRPTSAR